MRKMLEGNLGRLLLVLEDFYILVRKVKNDPDAKTKLTLNQLISRFNSVANIGGHDGQKVSMIAGIQCETLAHYFSDDPSGTIHRLEFSPGQVLKALSTSQRCRRAERTDSILLCIQILIAQGIQPSRTYEAEEATGKGVSKGEWGPGFQSQAESEE